MQVESSENTTTPIIACPDNVPERGTPMEPATYEAIRIENMGRGEADSAGELPPAEQVDLKKFVPLDITECSPGDLIDMLSDALTLAQELMDRSGQTSSTHFGLPDVDWRRHGWTLPGQIKKILEEVGEVSEALANQDPISTLRELLDSMQTCKTGISMVLDGHPEIDFELELARHNEKLELKEYL